MKRTLAVLATVATLGVTAVSAPAEARGIGPGLAFGLAGRCDRRWRLRRLRAVLWARLRILWLPGLVTITDQGRMPITVGLITIGTAIGAIAIMVADKSKSPEHRFRAFFS